MLWLGSNRRKRQAYKRAKELRSPWLLALAVAPQVAFGMSLPTPAIIACMAGLLVALFLNRYQRGLAIAAVGVGLNLLVIGLNSGMPVSGEAIEAISPGESVSQSDNRHVQASETTRLGFLGDVVPLWGRAISVGDIVLGAGLLLYLFDMSKPSLRPRTSQTLRERYIELQEETAAIRERPL